MKHLKLALAGVCALGLAACGGAPYYTDNSSPTYYRTSASAYAEYGRVVGIESVGGGGTSGAGAVIGGVVGGVLGHQVGSGRGNDAATVAGAIGGAVVGNEIEKRRNDGGYRVDVRTESGAIRSFMQNDIGDLRVGDRVRIDGDNFARY